MNLTVTKLQVSICTFLMRQDQSLTTYQVAKALRKDFYITQGACKTLFRKGYLDNQQRRWSLRRGKTYDSRIHSTPSLEDCPYS